MQDEKLRCGIEAWDVGFSFLTARLGDVFPGFPCNLSNTAKSRRRSRWALSPAGHMKGQVPTKERRLFGSCSSSSSCSGLCGFPHLLFNWWASSRELLVFGGFEENFSERKRDEDEAGDEKAEEEAEGFLRCLLSMAACALVSARMIHLPRAFI